MMGTGLPDLFSRAPHSISLAGGLPDLSMLPVAEVAEATARLLRLGARTLLQYTTPTVPHGLATAIRDLTSYEHMSPQPENLIPTAGSQQALVAVAANMPGATILCETPTYPGALAAFRTAGLRVVPVATDQGGVIVEDVERLAVALRAGGDKVSAVYVVPTFSNPTGATQDPARRSQLVEVCARLSLTIIEDNPYGMLSFEGRTHPALKSLAPKRVIYLGTFSKVFAPGLRAGWIDAPKELTARLRSHIEVQSLSPSPLSMAIIGEIHRRLGWDDLIAGYRTSYAQRASLASRTLSALLGPHSRWTWEEPKGGFYLWLTCLERIDTAQIAQAAADHGVKVVPGGHFHPDATASPSLRICYSHARPDQLEEGLRRLSTVLSDVTVLEGAAR